MMIPPTFCSPFLDTGDDDAVVQRSDVHALYSVCDEEASVCALALVETTANYMWRLAVSKVDC